MKPLQYHYDSDAARQLCDRYGARLEQMTRLQKLEAVSSLADRAIDLDNNDYPDELPKALEEMAHELMEFRNCIALASGILACI